MMQTDISDRPRRGASAMDTTPVSTPAPSDAPRPRPARKPFGGFQQKLHWPPVPGYRLYGFVDDQRGRIERAKEAGYEHVKHPDGSPVKIPSGTLENGNPQYTYIMKIPQEWFEEDMASQQREIDERERALTRGADAQGKTGEDGRYIPSRGIKIGRR